MESADDWNEAITSDFIVSTCQLLPRSCYVVSDLKHDPISSFGRVLMTPIMPCGSCEEFYIRPLNTCIDDLDLLKTFAQLLAFVEEFPTLPNDVRWLEETITCCKIEPSPSYPGFVRLRIFRIMNYNWKYKKYEFGDTPHKNWYIQNVYGSHKVFERDHDSSNKHTWALSNTVKGPALNFQSKQYPTTFDYVISMWCPQWPRQAQDWPKRQRDFGWPSIDKISEVVQNGCHVVNAHHRSCRNDVGQWRLSFSVAEVILLQSWTPVQQIVYHLLRFFAKREIIQKDCPKEDEVVCTYHLKTLMLWTCETMSPEWWNSASVIEISCELLKKQSEWLRRRYFPNYFIPEANLFHEPSSSAMVDKTERRLNEFRDSGILCRWFVENYIQPFIRTHIKVVKTINDRKVTPHLKDYKQALFGLRKSLKFKSFGILFSAGFQVCNNFYRSMITSDGLQSYILSTSIIRKFHLLIHSELPILPIPESIWCFAYLDSTLFSLNAACGLECEKISWDSAVFDEYIKEIFFKPQTVRCQYHRFSTPYPSEISRFQYLRAQEYMENLTGFNSRSEFQLMSHLAKEFLRKTLEKDDSQSKIIAPSALIYLAALHFATSENQIVMDLCSAFLMCETTHVENETLNAGCLFFINDVVRIVGFCLLCKKFNETMNFKKRQIYLDLRLTPKVVAYYLAAVSTERFSKHIQLNPDLETSASMLDQLLLTLTKRKLFTSLKSSISFKHIRECVYRRTQSSKRNATFSVNPLIGKEKLIDYLTECALENMTSFYSVIRKEFGIQCNTVDCYRALYLYKCRQYDEVLHLCERILREPGLKSDFNEFAFANVLLLPPLNSLFDRDVQSLLGFHTLFFHLSPLNDDLCRFGCTTESTFAHFFARHIYNDKGPLSQTICSGSYHFTNCHYFLKRHFLARYLILRCCIDCNHPRRKALCEFAALKCKLPFENIVRRFLLQKLRNIEE